MALNGKKVAVLAAQEYEDLELWYPKLRLEEAGAQVVVAGLGESSYPSKHGYPAQTDATVGDLDPATFSGVVVPGGWAPDYLRRSKAVTDFVAQVAASGGLVAAICHGGSVLISAGVVKGKRLTSVTAIRDDLVNAGADWIDAPVVVDQNLVTSRRPADLPVFMPAVIMVLEQLAQQGSETKLSVDADLIDIDLTDASFEYMLDMLNRMPAAKGYREGDASQAHTRGQILQYFASLSDPKGALEAEAPVVVDVTIRAPSGFRARGNHRLLTVLEGASVPGVARAS